MECKYPSDMAGKSIRCRAAVARKAGEPLILEDIEVLPPNAWEVRIKILCTSLCHSDVSTWKLKASVGEHVEEVKAGDLVLPVFQRNCGECKDCVSKRGNICTKFAVEYFGGMPRYGGATRFLDGDGFPIHHFLYVSSFSEYTVVDVTHVVKIGRDIPIDKACLLSCGVSTGIGAACKIADVEEGSTVAIFGLGSVGLAVAEGARLQGASRIIGVDISPDKFELGKKFGVTDFVNPTSCTEKSVSEVIREMTDGGADYCFECIGLVSLMQEAFHSSRQGCGKTIILGVDLHGAPLSINSLEILRGKSVLGCLFGGLKPKSDIPVLVNKYLDEELNLDEFITHEVGFEDINKAFDLLKEGKNLRCIIWMDH